MNSNLSVIKVNDIFDELSNENKRLLNELLFSVKCLNVLNKFKSFVDSVFVNYKTFFNSIDSQKFEQLKDEVNDVLKVIPKSNISFEDKPETIVANSDVEEEFSTESVQLLEDFKLNNGSLFSPEKTTIIPDMSSNTDELPVRFEFLSNLFANKDRIKVIRKRKPYIKQIQCKDCGKKFSYRQSFIKHMALKHTSLQNEKTHICQKCDKRFKYESNLLIHMKNHPISDAIQQNRIVCKVCNQSFPNQKKLNRHMKSHAFPCLVCNKFFSTDKHLKKHMTTHKTETLKPVISVAKGSHKTQI